MVRENLVKSEADKYGKVCEMVWLSFHSESGYIIRLYIDEWLPVSMLSIMKLELWNG